MDRLANLTSQYESHSKASAFVQYAIALAVARGTHGQALQVFERRWPRSKHLDVIRKAAVPAGTTDGWGAALNPLQGYASEFLELVRPATVLGRMNGFRRVPFRVKFPLQTAGATVGWVGEFKPIPVGKLTLDSDTFEHSKISGIVVLSKELAISSEPSAEALIQRDLIAAIAQFSDEQFLDPSVAEVDGVKPASITNGATAIPSSGNGAAAIEADLKALVAAVVASGALLTSPYFVMKPTTALHLATLEGANGNIFPNVNVMGGDIWGIPVLVSANAGNQITLIDAAEVLLADESIDIDTAEEAAVQMDTTPSDGAVKMVSLFQNSLVALKATRLIRWQRRRAGAAAYISGVSY